MREWLLILLTCILFVPLGTLSAQNLCTDGVLLFREDFGGNDPSDPEVISNAAAARAAVPGMSLNYTPCTSRTSGMSHGKFILTKQGYQNGTGTSQWHLQDDHTHFGDLTRGYLLEIDGKGDNAAFYSTTIDGLCEGLKLSFTAYVANVMTWGMYVGRPGYYAYPRLKFVLTDPLTNAELATYDTGDIPFDSAFIGDNMCWQQSAEWRLIGMNFTVPSGQGEVKLTIYNNTTGTTGNDFAIDDIEIRLCMTPDTIRTDTIVCDTTSQILWRDSLYSIADTLRDTLRSFCGFDSIYYVLNVNTEPCEEPLCTDGTLLFREDFGGNSPDDPAVSMASVPGMSSSYYNSGNSLGSGHYTLRKEGWKNGIQWHRQDDHTYFNDKTRGYLLEVDGRGDAVPFYTKRIDGLCAGTKLTFSAYIVNVHYAGQLVWLIENGRGYVYPRMKFVLKDPTTGTELASQSTGDIQPDWSQDWVTARTNLTSAEWQLFGINFTVPAGVESIQMYIYNDVASNGPGNDFALDDIEIHLCLPPVTIAAEDTLCVDSKAVMVAQFTNDGTLAEPLEYKWWYSADSVTWTEINGAVSDTLVLPAVQLADSGFYRVAVAGNGNIESVNCRAMSEPFRLTVPEPTDSLTLASICDYETFTWYGRMFNRDTTIVDTLVNRVGCDSICTLRLTVRPRMYSDTSATLCRGDVLLWHGQRLTTDGVYRDTVISSNGCDSVITLHLSLLEPTDSLTVASICDYETFTWYGRMFNRDTTIVDTLVNGVGCDSICTLRLTVRPRLYSDTTATLCRGDVLLWHGQRLTTDGVYRDTVIGSNGCDSVIRLNLSLLEPTGSLLKVEACDREAYLWNGRAFHRDTIVTDTLVNAVGCDSLSVLQLHMLSTLRTDTALTVCDTLLPITWHGQEIRRGGIYRDTLISSLACDSVVTLNVAVEVCYCDTLRAAATIGDVCADDDSLYVDLVYTDGLPAEYSVRFSSQAQQQGFPAEFGLPLTGHRNPLTLAAPIPHDPNDRQRYPRPDSYSVTLEVLDTCGVWRDWTLTFMVRYPSWLIVQKWDDVLALLNEDYNGGYVFSSIRWYHEGEAIASRGVHDSYIYEKPTLSFGEAYWVELTRVDDGVTISSCAVYPSLNRQGRERPASEEADRCRVYYIDGKQIAEYPLSAVHESLSLLPAGVYILIYYNKEGELIDTEKRVQRYE